MLFSAHRVTVPQRSVKLVNTDIKIELPAGTYGQIAGRSGLALQKMITIGGKTFFCPAS